MIKFSDIKIAVVGLGYVGLPLAIEFSKKFSVVGFDVNHNRISELRNGIDNTLEIVNQELDTSTLKYSSLVKDLEECNVYIVTVPTPIDTYNQPDLQPLIEASKMIGSVIGKGDIIIYESTVYPGATEEVCIPMLEDKSDFKLNEDFYVGYSPERINPGDKEHKITNIIKITSGSNKETALIVDKLYRSIITVGTHMVESIKIAEAAKVIENTQRDVNIALVNEFSIIFNLLNIDTLSVLKAAGTKWNFLPFRPGLVGGHCIGVDPYYLTHKAQSLGYHPEMILAGRRLNDGMAKYVVAQLVKKMLKSRIQVEGASVLILGLTFKENCPDIRNTKIVDIVTELEEYNINVDVSDPWCSCEDAKNEYDLTLIKDTKCGSYDAIIIAVSHDQFKEMGSIKIRELGKQNHVLYDLKSTLPKDDVDMRL
jgi:UDP-N-acetyl-D-glucosamine/UDP-N-acetyl-D-galactosamine dehydrogenase